MPWTCTTCGRILNDDVIELCAQCGTVREFTPLQHLLMNSAEEYHNHLKEHDLGIQKISIADRNKEQVEAPESTEEDPIYHTHWLLKLNGSLLELDTFYIREQRHEDAATWNNEDFKIIEYDNENRLLKLRFIRRETTFQDTPHHRLEIVSDLKFLIKNVEKWLRKNGQNLRLPTAPNTIAPRDDESENPFIENVLQYPVQYVWGPPGTGKTRHVLLNSVKEIVEHGGQAAILAPTNSAIENAVSPIIDAGFCAREDILRFGTPSHEFASSYPECCEETGVKKKIAVLAQQINSDENKLKIAKDAEIAISEIEEILPRFEQLHTLQSQHALKTDYLKRHREEHDLALIRQFQPKRNFCVRWNC